MGQSKKKININCGKAIILNKNLGELEGFEKGNINTGSMLVSQEAYTSLLARGFNINAGSTSVLNIKGKALLFEKGEQALHQKEEDLKDCFVVIEEDLIIPRGGTKVFSKVEGLYVGETLYYPDHFPLSSISGLRAEKMEAYPSDAYFIKERKWALDEEQFLKLEKGNLYFITGKLELVDSSLAKLQNNKGISFIAKELIIREEYLMLFENIKSEKRTVIPKGHELAENLNLSSTASILYGDKIYIKGDLIVQSKAVEYLNAFTSIVVEETAKLSVNAVPRFKKIGKARDIKVFEGELKESDGNVSYSHDTLLAAKEAGISYSLWGDGVLRFEEDVQSEDLDVFQTIRWDGVLFAPPKLMAFIQNKMEELDGVMLPLKGNMMDQLKGLGEIISGLGDVLDKKEKEEDVTNINTGNFIIV